MPLIREKLDVYNPAIQDIPLISRGMETVEENLINIVKDSDSFIQDKLVGLFESGKRLRPKLVLLSGLCFSPVNDDMIFSAVAAELIHTASLVHDDIIDRADYRRNKPTINYTCGNHVAVLAGDYLFAKAFEILSKKSLRSMEYLVIAIQEMCSGEMLQARELFNPEITETSYIEKTRHKTGSLLSACCMAGAVSGEADEITVEKFGVFGRFLGLAFQIIDDLLDFTGSKEQMGKSVAHDLEEGNITLPIIYLLENLEYRDKYKDLLVDRKTINDIKQQIIHDLENTGALLKTYKKAKFYAQEAKMVLEHIPNSVYKDVLVSLTEKVVHRIY